MSGNLGAPHGVRILKLFEEVQSSTALPNRSRGRVEEGVEKIVAFQFNGRAWHVITDGVPRRQGGVVKDQDDAGGAV